MQKVIVHISEVDIGLEGGMGRVEYYWREAFQAKGINFIHIGPKEVGKLLHLSQFPYKAYVYYKNLGIVADAFIVHEPASGNFVKRGIPCFVESHGIERRYWENSKDNLIYAEKKSLKTKILFPLWRLYNCDKGLRWASKLLLINSEDREYANSYYKRSSTDIFVFRNGVNIYRPENDEKVSENFTVLFNASWIGRKGISTLIQSAEMLFKTNMKIHFKLIGTGKSEEAVLNDWPEHLRSLVTVVPHFKQKDEISYLNTSSVFVLPSFYEGQPLSLLQAMAVGKCCITTNCCGQKDMIDDKKTGFLFEPGDYEELARLIGNCYENRDLVKSIGKSAMEYTRELEWRNVSNELATYVIEHI